MTLEHEQPFNSQTDPDFLDLVRHALRQGDYLVGERLPMPAVDRDGHYLMDFTTKDRRGFPVYIKLQHQTVAGTVEQKVPFKAIRLIHTVRQTNIDAGRDADEGARAYLVLGGEGWTARDFFTGHLASHLADGSCCTIMTIGAFIKRAQLGRL